MKTDIYPFAEISKIDKSIAEIIAFEGVEIDANNITELHKWKQSNLEAPCGILVNKINRYSYTFEAQMNLVDLEEIKAIAVVAYQQLTEISTGFLNTAPRKRDLNMKIFQTREKALDWLKTELAKS